MKTNLSEALSFYSPTLSIKCCTDTHGIRLGEKIAPKR